MATDTWNYLKDEQYYIDRYDLHTIEECLDYYWSVKDSFLKARNQDPFKKYSEEKFKGENFACLGYITWPSNFQPTQFLHFIGNWGQFLFEEISHEEELNYNYFYTSNISLEKNFLDKKNLLFDENFKYAAWEDIEFGYRLGKEGLKIIFNKNAIAFHNHIPTIESAMSRMETSGKSLFILFIG